MIYAFEMKLQIASEMLTLENTIIFPSRQQILRKNLYEGEVGSRHA